jgi:hypothetical protein
VSITTRPAAVHIDDLAEPDLPPAVREMMATVAPMAAQLSFTSGAVLGRARAETGLDDFGDDAFRERLGVLVRALDTEAGLNALGRVSCHGQLTQLAKNRLLLEDVLRRHPEINDLEITRPIVIAGLPRSGTTHLHNLLAADPALRSLPYWESLEPVLAAGEEPAPGEVDPRVTRTEAMLAGMDDALPYFKRMHEMTTWHVHEEIQLLAIDFSTMLFETMATIPTWRDYYKAHDQTPSYESLKTILKVLQWQRPGPEGPARTRWVLKSPQHLEQFGPLTAVFPDATVVVTHRDPVSITASLATMITYTARMSRERVDPALIGGYWAGRVADLLRACVRDRELLAPDRSVDVRFDEFMADDVATVERIYDLAGQPMTPEALAAMRAFIAEHPRGRHGGVRYDLADFGIDREERRKALRFYTERFGVSEERA